MKEGENRRVEQEHKKVGILCEESERKPHGQGRVLPEYQRQW